MISEARTSKAYDEGHGAWIATKGIPSLTMNPYARHSAQWKKWNEGWNVARKEFKNVNQKGEINMFDNNGKGK